MPNVRGFLRPKPKFDEREAVLAESRLVARLAGLFGDEVVDEIEPGEPGESAEPEIVAGDPPGAAELPREEAPAPAHRPPIIVIGGPPIPPPAGQPDEEAQPVVGIGVMAGPADGLGDDRWRLPGQPASVARRRTPARSKPVLLRMPGGPVERPAGSAHVSAAHCPYCGTLLQPPPAVSRRCEVCRQRILVKRVDGRTVYLAAAALPVFTAERQRAAYSARLGRERDRWLELARAAGAPSLGIAQVQAAKASEAGVAAARSLYLLAVDRTFRSAKRDREWDSAARLRRKQASTIHRVEGSLIPPSAEVISLFREGVAAELRGIAEISRDAQLVAAACCPACRADDEAVVRIAAELREPRLPHAGCPKGLCLCHWDLAARDRAVLRRYLRRRVAGEPRRAGTRPSIVL
jgi:hypothetical protein